MPKEKEYITIEEAATYIGVKRATLYNYLDDLKERYQIEVKRHKFGRDRRGYLALADVKLVKAFKDKPVEFDKERRQVDAQTTIPGIH